MRRSGAEAGADVVEIHAAPRAAEGGDAGQGKQLTMMDMYAMRKRRAAATPAKAAEAEAEPAWALAPTQAMTPPPRRGVRGVYSADTLPFPMPRTSSTVKPALSPGAAPSSAVHASASSSSSSSSADSGAEDGVTRVAGMNLRTKTSADGSVVEITATVTGDIQRWRAHSAKPKRATPASRKRRRVERKAAKAAVEAAARLAAPLSPPSRAVNAR